MAVTSWRADPLLLSTERLLQDFPAFDSIALGEGEELTCTLVNHLDDLSQVPRLCYRKSDGSIATNPSLGKPQRSGWLSLSKADHVS